MTSNVEPTVTEQDRDFLKIVEEKFIHIFDVFNEGLFYMDENGAMVFYNQKFFVPFFYFKAIPYFYSSIANWPVIFNIYILKLHEQYPNELLKL